MMQTEKLLTVGRFSAGENTTAAKASIGKQRVLLE